MADNRVIINRAPVLTLWGAIVCERQGYDRDTALTLGKAVAGLNAQSKGRALGIFGPPRATEGGGTPARHGLGEDTWVTVCGRPVPARHTEHGLRAVVGDEPIDPRKVDAYLSRSFGPSLAAVTEALCDLAESLAPDALAELSYPLYERFRPTVERGQSGWGQKGTLDLDLIAELAQSNQAG